MNLKYILILTSFWASSASAICYREAREDEIKNLEEKGDRLAEELADNLGSVSTIEGLINAKANKVLSGFNNLGVLKIKSREMGDLALKFAWPFAADLEFQLAYDRKYNSRFKEYIAAHLTLGNLRVAPHLRALLSQQAAIKLLKKDHILEALDVRFETSEEFTEERNATSYIGVAMDLLPEHNQLSRLQGPSGFMKLWCKAHIERAISEMAEIRKRVMAAGIFLLDQQLVVDAKGHVNSIDIDSYYVAPDKAARTDFTKEAENLIDRWQRASGSTLPPHEKSQLIGQLENRHPVCTDQVREDRGEWRDLSILHCPDSQEESTESVRAQNHGPKPSDDLFMRGILETLTPRCLRRLGETIENWKLRCLPVERSPFPELQRILKVTGLYTTRGVFIEGIDVRSLSSSLLVTALLRQIWLLATTALTRNPRLASVVFAQSEGRGLEINPETLGVTKDEIKSFLNLDGFTQKARCRLDPSVRKLCTVLQDLDFQLAYSRGQST